MEKLDQQSSTIEYQRRTDDGTTAERRERERIEMGRKTWPREKVYVKTDRLKSFPIKTSLLCSTLPDLSFPLPLIRHRSLLCMSPEQQHKKWSCSRCPRPSPPAPAPLHKKRGTETPLLHPHRRTPFHFFFLPSLACRHASYPFTH